MSCKSVAGFTVTMMVLFAAALVVAAGGASAQGCTEQLSHIQPNGSVSGTINATGKCDDYLLNVTESGTLHLLLSMPAGVDYDLTLYRCTTQLSCTQVKTSAGYNQTEEITTFVQPGTYDVEVKSYDGSSAQPYALSSQFTPSPAASGADAPDYWLQARPISLGAVVQETIYPSGDVDWFKVTLNATGTLTIALTHIPRGVDYDVYVFNEKDDEAIAWGINYNNADENVEVPDLPPGNYYIRVDSYYDDASQQPYTLTVLAGLAVTPTPTGPQAPTRDWTVMVYLDGDNNLEEFAIADLNEMERVGSSANVNVVVQLDRIPDYDRSNGNWADARRFYVTKDSSTSTIGSQYLGSVGEVDMGSATTLRDFVNWAVYAYPARHYALVLWDHGGGWEALLSDDTNGNAMTMPGLSRALAASTAGMPGQKLDLLVFDACLMANLEVFGQVAPYARVAVASEDLVPGDGLDYVAMLQAFQSRQAADLNGIARDIVQGYGAYYERTGYSDLNLITMSAVNLTALGRVTSTLDVLAGELMAGVDQQGLTINAIAWSRTYTDRYDYPSYTDAYYIDLYDFASHLACIVDRPQIASAARGLMGAINASVIDHVRGSAHAGSSGISITLADYDKQTLGYYRQGLALANQTRWADFMEKFYEAFRTDTGSPRIEDFRVSSNSNIGPSRPTTVSATVRDSNLLSVDLAVYRVDTDGQLLLVSSERVVPTTARQCGGGLVPLWNRTNNVSYAWNGTAQVISNGRGEWAYAYYYPLGAESPYYVTSGMLYWGVQSAEAQLVFNIDTGELVSAWLIDPWYQTPYQVLLEPGDEFVPDIYRFTSPEDNHLALAASRSWNHVYVREADSLHLEKKPLSELSSDQYYYIGLHTRDFAGNLERQLVDVSLGNYTGPPPITAPTGTTGQGGSTMYNAVPISGTASGFVGVDESTFYIFTAQQGAQLAITLYPRSGDSDLGLYDMNGEMLSYSENYGTTPDGVTLVAPYSGIYFVEVWGYEAGEFELTVGGSSGTAPTPTGQTPAATAAGTNFYTAAQLSGTRTGSLAEGRSHYYFIAANAGDQVTATLQPQGGDQDLYLYDMMQRLLAKGENYGTSVDELTFTAAYSGTYFVQVYAYEAGSYTLSVQGATGTTSTTTPGATRAPGPGLVAAIAALGVTAGAASLRAGRRGP